MTRMSSADYSRSQTPADASDDTTGDDDVFDIGRAPLPGPAGAGAPAVSGPLLATMPEALHGERIDKALARLFVAYSRSRLQVWLDAGRVSVDDAPARARDAARGGSRVVVLPEPAPQDQAYAAEPVPLSVRYEDETIAVIDKPAGLVVHPAAGNWSGTLLNGLLYRYGAAAAALPRAGIVHRLDKDTSGLMVVARTLAAQTDLVRQLQARTVRRRYLALAWGMPPVRGTVDAPIGRDPRDRVRMAVVAGHAGKPARTHFAVLAQGMLDGAPVALLQCDLDTGRTHQIRVHCAHLGHPLVGDPVYRPARGLRVAAPLPEGFSRQALHAWRLALRHPLDGVGMHWEVALPADMLRIAAAAGIDAAGAAGAADGTPGDDWVHGAVQ
jgi:23S rRNA pseudouridine1911/1915/1917 synthase